VSNEVMVLDGRREQGWGKARTGRGWLTAAHLLFPDRFFYTTTATVVFWHGDGSDEFVVWAGEGGNVGA
jgi:hypothetical protein